MKYEMNKIFDESLSQNIKTVSSLKDLKKNIKISIKKIVQSISSGGKVMFCGNGGSAADAQHLAAELMIQLSKKKRKAYPAISLALDSSTLTACANDFKYEKIFSRALEGIGKKNDILVVLSTSGNSKNILEVLKSAKSKKITSIGFFGNRGGVCKKYTNINLTVKSNNTARIQECHIFLGHFILGEVEKILAK